jgi:hypothetical protein
MAYTNSISIIIAAKDEASAVLKASAAQLEATAGRMNALGSSMAAAGAGLTKGFTVPLVAIGAVATDMAMTFQQKMEMLHTNAGIAQSAISGLSKSVLDMAGQVGQSPEALATAFYHVASAGTGIWNTAQQLDILKTASEGAAIGQANLDDTTYALTSALASNVKGTKDAADMMGTLNAIVGAGDMKLQDLNGAISTGFLSTAATFGISIQSVGTALATLTDNGEHADEAATRLRMTWALMSSPSSMAAKQLSALGLTAEDAKKSTDTMNQVFAKSGLTTTKLADDLRQPNGITVALKDLQSHLEASGMSASETDAVLSKAFGGGRTDAALLTLLQNIDRVDAKYKSITQNAGQFANNLADQNQTAAQKVKNAWSGIQADLVQLGTVILPPVATAFTALSDSVQTVFKWFQSLDSPVKTVLGYLTVGLAAGGPILWGLGKFIQGLQGIPDKIKGAQDAWGNLTDYASTAWEKLSSVSSSAADGAATFGSKVKDWGKTATDVSSSWTKSAMDTAKSWGHAAVDTTKAGVSTAASQAEEAASTAVAWAKAGVAMMVSSAKFAASAVIDAARAAGAWIVAAHQSELGLGGTLIKMVFATTEAAGQMVVNAAVTSAAWVKNAAISSYAWVTVELPKIIAGAVRTSASAIREAAVSSAAWVKNAAISSFVWVTQELPKIVASFVITSGSAVKNAAVSSAAWTANAAVTSAAWVTSAAVSSAAWVVQMARVSASFVATTVMAGVNAAAQAAMWIAATIQAGAYGIAIDAVKTKTALFAAMASSPITMGAIGVAGAIADIMLVYNAVNAVRGAINAMDAAAASKSNEQTQRAAAIANMENLIQHGSPTQQADSRRSLHSLGVPGYATGGFTGPGNTTDVAGVVHKGEYVIPKSMVDQRTGTPKAMGGSSTVNIANLNVNNNVDIRRIVREIGFKLQTV